MNNMSNLQIKKILAILIRAKNPVPLGYISLHSGIKEPLEILDKLEEQGLVRRNLRSCESCYMDPMFEIIT